MANARLKLRGPRPPAGGSFHEDFSHEEAFPVTRDRIFGLAFAVAFTVIAILPWGFGSRPRWWALGVAAGVTLVATLRPRLLAPLNRWWRRGAEGIHEIVSHLLMGATFYLVITPTALVLRVIGRDSLRRRFDPSADSYWIHREMQREGDSDMRRQF
jgi:hypothetical protein